MTRPYVTASTHLLVALLTVMPLSVVAAADDGPARGEATAVCVEKGPACDGTLNSPLWEKCPPWPLGACTSADPQKYKTWAKVLIDATHVHVGVYCEEPDTAGLVAQASNRDDPVWSDDSVEVFLRPDPQQAYCQFAINSRGTLYDAREKQAGWNSSAKAAATVEQGKSWTATLSVPMSELGAYVGDDQLWTLNIHRSRKARGGRPGLQYSWSIMSDVDYHAASEFGLLSGVNVPQRAGGVTRIRSTPAPRPAVMNQGREVGGVRVYHKMTFDEGPEGWTSANNADLRTTGDAVDGQALQATCTKNWSGAGLPIGIAGSRELKVAMLMKGQKLPSVGVNVYDLVSRDNTTSYGYRYLDAGQWTPALYYLDRFRYNSRTQGYVGARTIYNSITCYGPTNPPSGAQFSIDNFVVYRGADGQAPEKVAALRAEATRGGVRLSWRQAADNVAAQLYVIARAEGTGAFAKIAESRTTTYLDVTAGKAAYRYRVFAVDFEENFGPWSDPVDIRSTSEARRPKSPREVDDRLVYAAHVRKVHARGAGKVHKNHATLFGDSLTGATSYPQCAESAFGTLPVDAFGYPSMRTSFGRNKVHEILQKQNPEFMFILYGTNNNKSPQHIPAAMDDLAAIVLACQQRGTVALLGTIPPRGWTPASAPEANFNRHVVELCRKLNIPCGYIFESFQAAGAENRRTYLGGDGVHWRGEGMKLAAEAWDRALDQVRFVVRDQP